MLLVESSISRSPFIYVYCLRFYYFRKIYHHKSFQSLHIWREENGYFSYFFFAIFEWLEFFLFGLMETTRVKINILVTVNLTQFYNKEHAHCLRSRCKTYCCLLISAAPENYFFFNIFHIITYRKLNLKRNHIYIRTCVYKSSYTKLIMPCNYSYHTAWVPPLSSLTRNELLCNFFSILTQPISNSIVILG